MTRSSSSVVSAFLIALSPAAGATNLPPPAPVHGELHAIEVTVPVTLDGRLDEPFWSAADSIDDFRQREPDAGAPGSERTVVRIARDSRALYFGIRAWDRDMATLRATQLRRDADLESDDNLAILIDGYRHFRNAFLFETNARGAMRDAQVSGPETGDPTWDGIWEVATMRDSAGWTAEFRIPFRTLRYPPGSETFGFNVRRYHPRRNEEDLWRSFGRTEGFWQLQNCGRLTGLGSHGRSRELELRPYALGQAIESEYDLDGARTRSSDLSGKTGLDLKTAIAPTITADLTLHTDFAQVEADQQVVNLTRFPLFFPEKREFFLESSDLFAFGGQSSAMLFYSRRIGLLDGAPVPIVAGARVFGRLGPWSIGVLDAGTGAPENANDVVVRLKHDLLQRSSIGVIGTLQSAHAGVPARPAGGVDLDFPVVVAGQNLEPALWVAATQDTDAARAATGWRASVDFPNDLFDHFVSLSRIDPGFDPPLGFVRRAGVLRTTGHLDYLPRPHRFGVRQFDFALPTWDVYADEHSSLGSPKGWQTGSFEVHPLAGVTDAGDEFELNLQRQMDAPREAFPIFRDFTIPPGRYWWTRAEAQIATSSGRPFAASVVAGTGDFYDGRDTELDVSGTWRGGGHLILTGRWTSGRVRLPSGSFTAVAVSNRLEYALDTHTDLLVLAQYQNEDQRVDFDVRFHWSPVAGDDFYAVWNSGYSTDSGARYRFPRRDAIERPLNGGLVLKFVYRIAP